MPHPISRPSTSAAMSSAAGVPSASMACTTPARSVSVQFWLTLRRPSRGVYRKAGSIRHTLPRSLHKALCTTRRSRLILRFWA